MCRDITPCNDLEELLWYLGKELGIVDTQWDIPAKSKGVGNRGAKAPPDFWGTKTLLSVEY